MNTSDITNLLNSLSSFSSPQTGTSTGTSTTADTTAGLNAAIPGFSGLTGQASGVIKNLLSGTPSTQTAQNAAATFGITSGMGPGSGMASAYGTNLYDQQAQQNQQQGVTDLLSMLGGY